MIKLKTSTFLIIAMVLNTACDYIRKRDIPEAKVISKIEYKYDHSKKGSTSYFKEVNGNFKRINKSFAIITINGNCFRIGFIGPVAPNETLNYYEYNVMDYDPQKLLPIDIDYRPGIARLYFDKHNTPTSLFISYDCQYGLHGKKDNELKESYHFYFD